VTIAAAGALAQIGDLSAFRSLFALLTEEDPAVRQAAIGALNSLGHPEMSGHVTALLAGADPRGRESAVRIAGYFGYAECASAVLACCGDADESVRRAALEQVPFLAEEGAVAILERALDRDTPRARAAAAGALGKVAGAAAREALHRAVTDSDTWVRYFAARSLAQHRHEPDLDVLAKLAAADPAPYVRIAALDAIGAIDGPRAAALLAVYAEDEDSSISAAAIAALGHVADAEALQCLLQALRSPDPVRRLAAIGGLAEGGGAERVMALRWTAAADADDDTARAALAGLGRLAAEGSGAWEDAVDALLELSGVPSRREPAVAALAGVPVSRMGRVASGLSHASDGVRRAAVDALIRMKTPAASARVREALADGDAVVREAAVTALDRVGTPGLFATFARLAEHDPAVEVRRVAAAAIARHADRRDDGASR
jgi:HEAT repeat protein